MFLACRLSSFAILHSPWHCWNWNNATRVWRVGPLFVFQTNVHRNCWRVLVSRTDKHSSICRGVESLKDCLPRLNASLKPALTSCSKEIEKIICQGGPVSKRPTEVQGFIVGCVFDTTTQIPGHIAFSVSFFFHCTTSQFPFGHEYIFSFLF